MVGPVCSHKYAEDVMFAYTAEGLLSGRGRAQRSSGFLGELTWLLATLDHDHGNRRRLVSSVYLLPVLSIIGRFRSPTKWIIN